MNEFKREKVYSLNDEEYTDLQGLMDQLYDSFPMGARVEVYEADQRQYTHDDFISTGRLIEQMRDSAYGEAGEHADGYMEDFYTVANAAKLHAVLFDFFTEHAKQPQFYTAVNAKKITITVE